MGKFSLGSIGSSPGTFKESYLESFIIDFHGSVESCRGVINHLAVKQLRRAYRQVTALTHSP